MPKELLSIDAQARKCTLAFLKTPNLEHELGEVSDIYINLNVHGFKFIIINICICKYNLNIFLCTYNIYIISINKLRYIKI